MSVPAPAGEPPRPPGTPGDVVIRWQARKPELDPTLGIPVEPAAAAAAPAHRLVTVGDSLTHGFQSLAIHHTSRSWPALVARELGLGPAEFRYPTYEAYGGIPLNLEVVARALTERIGRIDLADDAIALVWLLHFMHEVKHWWTHHADDSPPPAGMNHNLAVYSYDVRNAYTATLAQNETAIAARQHGLFHLMTPHDVDRAAKRVLAGAEPPMTLVDAAKAHGDDGGIETLVVALGSNNVLDVVINLQYCWATSDETRVHGHIWSPALFREDWAGLVDRIRQIDARHVILATVPHVTVVPLFAAAGERLRPDSRYFEHYTHYWLRDRFDPRVDVRYLTGDQARAVDSAIDQYNDAIVETVRTARQEGRDWHLLEMSGLLDRLAWRRYLTNEASRPDWWDEVGGEYPLPGPLGALEPKPDTQFLTADEDGRTAGGLIALDGVHPTTVGYGILAQEVIRVMEVAGVQFARPSPVEIDFAALLQEDRLVSDPPPTLTSDLHVVGWINKHVDILAALRRRI